MGHPINKGCSKICLWQNTQGGHNDWDRLLRGDAEYLAGFVDACRKIYLTCERHVAKFVLPPGRAHKPRKRRRIEGWAAPWAGVPWGAGRACHAGSGRHASQPGTAGSVAVVLMWIVMMEATSSCIQNETSASEANSPFKRPKLSLSFFRHWKKPTSLQ